MPELHTMYRPRNFSEFFGNETLKAVLQENIQNDDLPRAIMFHGERGSGKTTLARIMANESGASYIREVNIAVTTGVDDMRKLLGQTRIAPLTAQGESKKRFYILDEFHQGSTHAQQALLKDSEELPPDVYFVICTTNPEKIVKTIRSRFAQFEVQPLKPTELMELMGWVLREEGITEMSSKVLRKIATACEGIPREALVMLNKVIGLDEDIALDAITFGVKEADIRDICLALGDVRISDPWPNVRDKLKAYTGEAETARIAIASWLNAIVLNPKTSSVVFNRAVLILPNFLESFFYSGKPGLTAACLNACMDIKEG